MRIRMTQSLRRRRRHWKLRQYRHARQRTLRLQSEEMKERQKFFREQGQRMEQVTAGLGDLESVLTAKQQKALMKRRKDVLARQEEEGGEVGEAPRAEDDGAVTPPIEPEVVPDNSPGIEV